MATEYGLFNDEGCLERGHFSVEAATAALDSYEPEDDAEVLPMCPTHPVSEEPEVGCELCAAEDEEDPDASD